MVHSPVHFAIGFHCHQPVGNFEEVCERNYRSAYRPLLDTMARHVSIPFSLHMTGPLLEWLDSAHPAYLDRVAGMAAEQRIEVKGGPFYEAILPLIHSCDRAAQLDRMQSYLQRRLGIRPRGAWIPERVWEPQLARDLAEAGLHYAMLDDTQFEAAGSQPATEACYYVTEDQGSVLDLLPISRRLRYLIPFEEPSATRDFLRGVFVDHRRRCEAGICHPGAPPPLIVCEDDGEKFGAWPRTYAHVHEHRWLDRFLSLLEKCAAEGWLKLTTPSSYREHHPPGGLVYLAAGSYAEMEGWSGGNFRNFLVRYTEANRLHKRMLSTSQRCREQLHASVSSTGDSDQARSAGEAYECALRGQCNDAYWHGIFGGLYLPHLRQAVYANLIRAESMLPPGPPITLYDADCDGHVDVRLRSESLMALVSPLRGGSIWSLDHLPMRVALLDTLRRRREPEYDELERSVHATSAKDEGAVSIHDTVRVKEPGMHQFLRVDPYPRDAFLDHFYPPALRWQDLHDACARDLGDFAAGPYEMLAADGKAACEMPALDLHRVGRVAGWMVAMQKRLQLTDASLCVTYRVKVLRPASAPPSAADTTGDVCFAPELTVNLLGGAAPGYFVTIDGEKPASCALGDGGTHPGAESITLVDGTRGLSVVLRWAARMRHGDDRATLHRHGIWTVSLSEDGFEKVFQGTALVPAWTLPLRPGETLDASIILTVEEALSGTTTPRDLPL